jgi:hypothetical protein
MYHRSVIEQPAVLSDRHPSSRREALRDALLDTIDKLHRRRASEIPEGLVEDYVTLNWLEWHGGGLRVTITGQNLCSQLRQRI